MSDYVKKTISITSRFRRVIFENYKAAAYGRQLGITYETFQLGKSYVNRLTNNGLLHDGPPQNAMIYTVKTKFIQCQKYSDNTTRTIYEAEYTNSARGFAHPTRPEFPIRFFCRTNNFSANYSNK